MALPGVARPVPTIPGGFEGGLAFHNKSDRDLLYGTIGTDVAAVEVRSTDETPLGRATVVEGQSVRAWVVEVTATQVDIVALDDAGQEVDRIDLQ